MNRCFASGVLTFAVVFAFGLAQAASDDVTLENARFRLTAAEKRELADPKLEHHAYLRPDGEIEIVRITPVKTSDEAVKAFSFTARDGRKRLLYWHQTGTGSATVEVDGRFVAVEAAGWTYLHL